jgi:hypothetical protein
VHNYVRDSVDHVEVRNLIMDCKPVEKRHVGRSRNNGEVCCSSVAQRVEEEEEEEEEEEHEAVPISYRPAE